jgi:hypothetical protein
MRFLVVLGIFPYFQASVNSPVHLSGCGSFSVEYFLDVPGHWDLQVQHVLWVTKPCLAMSSWVFSILFVLCTRSISVPTLGQGQSWFLSSSKCFDPTLHLFLLLTVWGVTLWHGVLHVINFVFCSMCYAHCSSWSSPCTSNLFLSFSPSL